MDISLSEDALDQLNTEEAKALHETSNNLSARGVGRIVNLPQIIVVGEQSSGKSSVLEAISRVRFPVQGGLCTRFATELVLRRGTQTRIDVSVKFADSSKPSKTFQRTGFQESDLPEIVRAAKECMGFSETGGEFSKDVLRLEIEGPGMYPLTLVDLPGLFQADTETQSLAGKETVDQLVESYMRQKNSIILVVISANNQLANQVALRKVKEFDPARERTIGVITKPDLTRPGFTDESMYVRVAKNQETANKLKLGWHVLRNRAEDEPSLEARDEVEAEFFQNGAWATISPEDLGISNLRKKLSNVLFEHIRRSLPGVIQDIEVKLRERQEELQRLGKARSKPEDRRKFLLTIAGEFQRLARDGIHGHYSDAFFGALEDEDRKLRAQLRNLNRIFDHVLLTKGSSQFIDPEDGSSLDDHGLSEHLEELLEKYPYDFADPETITLNDLNAQLQKQASANQGRELPGLPNKDLAIKLFQKQAAPWKEIAQFHIGQVTLVVKAFVDELFRHVIGPADTSRATEAILSACVDPFFSEKEERLQAKLEELLRPYAQGYALPLDAAFHRALSEKTWQRMEGRLWNILEENYPSVFDQGSKRKVTQLMAREAISGDDGQGGNEFATETIIEMALAFYEMSRRTFTENIINLAIESCLICDIPDILTPTKVDGMSAEELAELAAESEDAQPRREHLLAEIEILRQSLARCRKHRPRAVTALPPSRRSPAPPETKASRKRIVVRLPNPPPQATSPSPQPQAAPPRPEKSSESTIIRDAIRQSNVVPVPAISVTSSGLLPPRPSSAVSATSNTAKSTSSNAESGQSPNSTGSSVPSSASPASGGLFNFASPPSGSRFNSSTSFPSGGLFGSTSPAPGGLFSIGKSSGSSSSSASPSVGGLFGSDKSSSTPLGSSPLTFGHDSPSTASSGFALFGSPSPSQSTRSSAATGSSHTARFSFGNSKINA